MIRSENPPPAAREAASTGVEMPPALRALALELPARRTADAMLRLSERISAGESWDAAMRARDVRLPIHLRGLLQASLRAQRLPEALTQLVELERRRGQLGREIWMTLAYPLVLLVSLGVLFFLYEICLIREVMSLHADVLDSFRLNTSMAAALPSLTQLALVLSQPAPLLGIALAIAAVAGLVIARQTLHPPRIDAWFNRLPVLGSLWHWSALADCLRLLRLLLEAEIPLPQALGMAAAATRNGEIAAGCRQLAAQVQLGHGLAQAVEQSSAFPRTLVPLVRWGESHSALPEALDAAAEMLEGRVRVHLGFVRTFLPPFLFLLVAGAILCSMLAAFLPMFRLLEALA
jgi:type II secretory pathway component PulF